MRGALTNEMANLLMCEARPFLGERDLNACFGRLPYRGLQFVPARPKIVGRFPIQGMKIHEQVFLATGGANITAKQKSFQARRPAVRLDFFRNISRQVGRGEMLVAMETLAHHGKPSTDVDGT